MEILEFMNSNLKPEYMWLLSAIRIMAALGLAFLFGLSMRENRVNPKSGILLIVAPLSLLLIYYLRILIFGSDSKASGWLILLHGSIAWFTLGASVVIVKTQAQRDKLVRLVKHRRRR